MKSVGDSATVGHARPMTLKLALVAALLAVFSATPALAQDNDLIHSDAPLWKPGSDKVSPSHFTDGDSFGCVHRMKLGVWRYTETASGAEEDFAEDDTWYRFTNYGVFHCWMNVSVGYEPGKFMDSRPGFLIALGDMGGKQLWAFQLGARPGSDYLLLARPVGDGPIDRFEVLQRECSKAQLRGGPSLDILITRYCAINSQEEMTAMARRMAKRPPLGVMTFERGEEPESD
jgi:hypothetical protein